MSSAYDFTSSHPNTNSKGPRIICILSTRPLPQDSFSFLFFFVRQAVTSKHQRRHAAKKKPTGFLSGWLIPLVPRQISHYPSRVACECVWTGCLPWQCHCELLARRHVRGGRRLTWAGSALVGGQVDKSRGVTWFRTLKMSRSRCLFSVKSVGFPPLKC